ncbi:hypothetical protein [Glycomyces buryatensis]|uniref:DUF3995 domain-containing protein n=1 Tax=Glycomyces buryatensis TaxID=2570927 RepID=A0A4S8PY85_9ACTN|nr:hypothetical protein [Glycomyces buryatensis]THV35621.1 hypothetical protein FAB82_22350 [Glycomyces buryatensis]
MITTTAPRPTTPAAHTYPVLTWAPTAILLWAVLYGALQTYWALGNAPEFAPLPQDLLVFHGWGAVGLCAAVAAAALGLRLTRESKTALIAAWAVAAAMLAASPMFFLDVIGGILGGLGIAINGESALSRGGMVTGAALLTLASLTYLHRMRGACGRCGRKTPGPRPERVPGWAVAAAYAAVAGCFIRLAAQYGFAGFDAIPYNAGVSAVLFEIGFILAGTLLPLALVHRWGLIWPRWVLGLAGSRVPRWLVLGPALFIAGGMTAYFGFQQLDLIGMLFTGWDVDTGGSPYSPAFFWVSIPAYTVWGLGIGVAAIARLRQTRPQCKRCEATERTVNAAITIA